MRTKIRHALENPKVALVVKILLLLSLPFWGPLVVLYIALSVVVSVLLKIVSNIFEDIKNAIDPYYKGDSVDATAKQQNVKE